MNRRRTRWTIGSAVAGVWTSLALAAMTEVSLHWYLAIVLAAAAVTGGAFTYVLDARSRAREAERSSAGSAEFKDAVRTVCAAIAENARRFEVAADSHGERLRTDVFTIDRLMVNMYRGEVLAQYDAALEEEERIARNDTGPLPTIR